MFGWNNFYSNHTYLTIELYIIGAHSSNNPSWNDGQKWYQYSKKRIWIQFLKSFILFDWLNAYSKIWKVNTNQLLNILYKLVGPTSIAEPIHEWHVYWVYILNKYSDAIRSCTLNILCSISDLTNFSLHHCECVWSAEAPTFMRKLKLRLGQGVVVHLSTTISQAEQTEIGSRSRVWMSCVLEIAKMRDIVVLK